MFVDVFFFLVSVHHHHFNVYSFHVVYVKFSILIVILWQMFLPVYRLKVFHQVAKPISIHGSLLSVCFNDTKNGSKFRSGKKQMKKSTNHKILLLANVNSNGFYFLKHRFALALYTPLLTVMSSFHLPSICLCNNFSFLLSTTNLRQMGAKYGQKIRSENTRFNSHIVVFFFIGARLSQWVIYLNLPNFIDPNTIFLCIYCVRVQLLYYARVL